MISATGRKMTASDLYAISQGKENQGFWECHWCGSPCDKSRFHDDPPLIIGDRRPRYALRPANPYICQGCWLWRRKNMYVRFLNGTILDRQEPKNHSWYITEKNALGIRKIDYPSLHEIVLNPPKRFILSFKTDNSLPNLLQLLTVNDFDEIKADTQIHYNINHSVHSYNIYELEHLTRNNNDGIGISPGVMTLVGLIGIPAKELLPPEENPRPAVLPQGRPPAMDNGKITKRIIRK